MLQFAKNQTTVVTRRNHNGIDYLIAPVVAIKPGVLNEELVTAEEIEVSTPAWNGRPVVLNHPEVGGDSVSANDPDILARFQVGQLFNVSFVDNSLKGELWLDIARAKALGGDALNLIGQLEANQQVEVSTAYFRDLQKKAGTLHGEDYVGIAKNLNPDHIAILLHDTGACSWEDGCGAPRVNLKDFERMVANAIKKVMGIKSNILSSARRPGYDGIETISWESVSKTFADYRDGYYKHTGESKPSEPITRVQDAPRAMRAWIAKKSLLGDPDAEDWSNLLFFPVVNPGTNRLNAGAVRAVLSGRGAGANIPQAAKDSAAAEARRLLEKEFRTESVEVNQVEETIKRLSELLELSEDEAATLSGVSEDVLKKLADALETLADATEPEGEIPEAGEQEPVANQQLPPGLVGLAEAIEKRGGLDSVLAAFDNIKAGEDAVKADIVSVLVANAACTLTKEQLDILDISTLQALQRSFIPADYSGRGGGPLSRPGDLIDFEMPDVFAEA